jgi:hypothetical protein
VRNVESSGDKEEDEGDHGLDSDPEATPPKVRKSELRKVQETIGLLLFFNLLFLLGG